MLVTAFAVSSHDSRYVLHEKRAAEPIHWTNTGRLDSDRVLPMRFGLAQQNSPQGGRDAYVCFPSGVAYICPTFHTHASHRHFCTQRGNCCCCYQLAHRLWVFP